MASFLYKGDPVRGALWRAIFAKAAPPRVWVNRGHEPRCEGYATHEIDDIGGLPALVGL